MPWAAWPLAAIVTASARPGSKGAAALISHYEVRQVPAFARARRVQMAKTSALVRILKNPMSEPVIERIEVIHLALPYSIREPKLRFAGRPLRALDMLIVEVTTSDGVTGYGVAFGYNTILATKAALEQLICPLALGQTYSDIAGLHAVLAQPLSIVGRNGPVHFALSGLDNALRILRANAQVVRSGN